MQFFIPYNILQVMQIVITFTIFTKECEFHHICKPYMNFKRDANFHPIQA